MGIDVDFGKAFAKAEVRGQKRLPQGTVFISMNDRDKAAVIPVAQELADLGFKLIATSAPKKFLWMKG
jgi:carbamoyl-phosphate synthase large subunit